MLDPRGHTLRRRRTHIFAGSMSKSLWTRGRLMAFEFTGKMNVSSLFHLWSASFLLIGLSGSIESESQHFAQRSLWRC